MATSLFLELVFNKTDMFGLSPQRVVDTIAPGKLTIPSYVCIPPVNAKEFESEDDGVFLRPFLNWINEQTTSEFNRKLRRMDFVNVFPHLRCKPEKVATWMIYNQKTDSAKLRGLFTAVLEDSTAPPDSLAWGRLHPHIAMRVPSVIRKI